MTNDITQEFVLEYARRIGLSADILYFENFVAKIKNYDKVLMRGHSIRVQNVSFYESFHCFVSEKTGKMYFTFGSHLINGPRNKRELQKFLNMFIQPDIGVLKDEK